jgi:hypothetical protein
MAHGGSLSRPETRHQNDLLYPGRLRPRVNQIAIVLGDAAWRVKRVSEQDENSAAHVAACSWIA